jgi:spore coat polysaccharide biosynthesis protein SpsF
MKPRVVAVIQARMGSTRLPGKVLKPVAGKPLLWHIVHRLKKSTLIDAICVATSVNPLDDAIAEFGAAHGVTVVRGPEDDVLARFARAAEVTDADIIVRVNADAPFIDAEFIDHLVTALIEQDGDYVLLEEHAETAHCGVDPFTRRALDKLMLVAGEDPVAREHVTGYFKLHPDFVPIARSKPYPKLAKSGTRLTVDTPDDLAFFEAVHARLAAKAGEASLADLLMLLEREPMLREINAHVRQKNIAPQGGLALIRCDGGGSYGFGHVKRMIALARALRDREGLGAVFAVNGSADALPPIRQAGFAAKLIDGPEGEFLALAKDPDLLILDCREGPSREAIAALPVPLKAVVDDASERRLACDLAYYPPVPQTAQLVWSGSACRARVGWEWALLGQQQMPERPRSHSPCPTLLVTMGGSDPFGLTERAALALRQLDPVFRARFVIGPGFKDKNRLARSIVSLSPNFETVEGAHGLETEFAACDVALVAFGVTAYELAAAGVPAIYLGISDDHTQSASAFEQAGMGLSLGTMNRVSNAEIAQAVWSLLNNGDRRRQMRAAGLMTIDGSGASRIAADLAGELAARRAKPKPSPKSEAL